MNKDRLIEALEDMDDCYAAALVAEWLERMPDADDRRTNLERIIRAMDKGTRQHIGEVFFDVDAEVGADEEG